MNKASPRPPIWTNRRRTKANALILNEKELLILSLSPDELEELATFRDLGTPHGIAIRQRARCMELEKLSKVLSNERKEVVTLQRDRGTLASALTNNPYEIDNLHFESAEERDRFWTAIRTHLEPRFQFKRVEWSRLRAISTYLLMPAFAAFITWGFWMAAGMKDYEPTSSKSKVGYALFKPLLDLIGPTGVLIIGGATTAALLVLAIRKASDPPVMLKLTKAPRSAQSRSAETSASA